MGRTLAIFLFVSAAQAQITLSTIRGTVNDQTGATVPQANITVVHQETNLKRVTTANENGDFEIPDLQRGTYKMTVSGQGFKTFVADNILLESSQVRRVNAQLEIGAVSSEVTVKADAAVISTDSSKITGTISGEKHPDMPWVGAEATLDPSLFLTTLPLIQQRGGVWGSIWAGQATSQVQEGQDGHTNDGAVNQLNDIFDVQEINVVTVNNTAEFARVGYMNMVTKSGSNKFHGRALYWHQNSAFGAKEFFEARKSKLLIHTISGSVSGPIRRDKTFFYTSANILKVPGKQFYLRSVPSNQMRRGDFSQLLPGARPTVVRDPLNGTPFPNNTIPSARISAVSQKINEKYLPAPNIGGNDALARNFSFVFPFPTDYSLREDFSQRIDHHISDKNRLMGRMIWNWDLYVLPTNFPAFSWTRKRSNFHFVVEDTHVFSPSLVNSLRVGLYIERVRDGDTLYGVTPFKGDDVVKELGIQGVNPQGLSAQGFPRVDIAGYDTLRTQPGGYVQDDHNWGIADSITWSNGRHVLKFGGEFKPQRRFVGNVPEGTYGTFNFNGSLSGYGYSDFLLGLPFTSSRLDPLTNRIRRDNELGIYLTDSWKVTSRLTMDLGLRWDRFGRPNFNDGLVWRFDLDSNKIVIPGDGGGKVSPLYPANLAPVAGDVGPYPEKGNFAPRIGGAYRLWGDKAVIRAGYGIYTETLGRYARLLTGGPYELSESFNNEIRPTGPLFAFPSPFPAVRGSVASQSATAFPLNTANGYIHQYNVTLERQLRDMGFRLSYVGSRNVGINYNIGINKPQPSLTAFAQARRPYPQFIGVTNARNNGEQKFNAVTFEVQRKVGQLTFDGHWTLASSYTNLQNLENPYAPLFWARDPNTSRQRGVVNAVWQIPVGKGRKFMSNAPRAVDHAFGGWQLYWIGYFQTGLFFTPTFAGSDPSNTQTVGGRPDRLCNGNLPPGQRSINRWFDASCFAPPTAGRFGNSGDAVLEGPGYNMNHISIAKSVNFTERLAFTFTAAATNAFNHANFAVPAANISAPTVGTVSNLVDGGRSRRIELRGRLEF